MIMKIQERKYRGSLICRTVAYPISYAIVKMLSDNGPMKLEQIVKQAQHATYQYASAFICLNLIF